jgi:hypothetical protein
MQNRGPRAGVLDDRDEAELEELEAELELASEEAPTARTTSSLNASAALKCASLPFTLIKRQLDCIPYLKQT